MSQVLIKVDIDGVTAWLAVVTPHLVEMVVVGHNTVFKMSPFDFVGLISFYMRRERVVTIEALTGGGEGEDVIADIKTRI